MLTSVFKDILDHSIDAQKLGGGSMDQDHAFDLLYAWRIIAGNSLTKGVSEIDSVDIGKGYAGSMSVNATSLPSSGYFKYVRIFNRTAGPILDMYSKTGVQTSKLYSSTTEGGIWSLYNASGDLKSRMSAETSYFLNMVIVGAATNPSEELYPSSTYKFVVSGNVGVTGTVKSAEVWINYLSTYSSVAALIAQLDTWLYLEAEDRAAADTKEVEDRNTAIEDAITTGIFDANFLQLVVTNGATIYDGLTAYWGANQRAVINESGVYLMMSATDRRFSADADKTVIYGPGRFLSGSGGALDLEDNTILMYDDNQLGMTSTESTFNKKVVASAGISNTDAGAALKWIVITGAYVVPPGGMKRIDITSEIDSAGISENNCLGFRISLCADSGSLVGYFINENYSPASGFFASLDLTTPEKIIQFRDTGVMWYDGLSVKYRIIVYYQNETITDMV